MPAPSGFSCPSLRASNRAPPAPPQEAPPRGPTRNLLHYPWVLPTGSGAGLRAVGGSAWRPRAWTQSGAVSSCFPRSQPWTSCPLGCRLAGCPTWGRASQILPGRWGSYFSILFLPQRLPAPRGLSCHRPQLVALLVPLSREGETGCREPQPWAPGQAGGLRDRPHPHPHSPLQHETAGPRS